MATEVEKALDVLKKAMRDDPHYAHTWHCNIAMAFYDSCGDQVTGDTASTWKHEVGNEAASRFMKQAFDVENSEVPDGQV